MFEKQISSCILGTIEQLNIQPPNSATTRKRPGQKSRSVGIVDSTTGWLIKVTEYAYSMIGIGTWSRSRHNHGCHPHLMSGTNGALTDSDLDDPSSVSCLGSRFPR